MIRNWIAPAIKEVVMYLINGNRNFIATKDGFDKPLYIRFMATDEYIEKMKARPFLRNIDIVRKA